MSIIRNVLGDNLKPCCQSPVTGFYRDGYCSTGDEDLGRHVVCVELNDEFLQFSKSKGNDLITPNPLYGFPGLKAGDRWCLCALRWQEAFEARVAPKVLLESCHEAALEIIKLEDLRSLALK